MTGPTSSRALLLEATLTSERLAPYRRAVGGSLDDALALYEWNAAVGAAFFEELGHLEVFLRNTLHAQLAARHIRLGLPGEWFDDPAHMLDQRRHTDIATARANLARDRKTETPGRVVAELSFGFWRFLLDRRYQTTLWAPALRLAFPHLQPQRRADVYDPVYRLHRLRNRIAHQEPIHHQDLPGHHHDLHRVAAYLDPDLRDWLAERDRVTPLLAGRPGPASP